MYAYNKKAELTGEVTMKVTTLSFRQDINRFCDTKINYHLFTEICIGELHMYIPHAPKILQFLLGLGDSVNFNITIIFIETVHFRFTKSNSINTLSNLLCSFSILCIFVLALWEFIHHIWAQVDSYDLVSVAFSL